MLALSGNKRRSHTTEDEVGSVLTFPSIPDCRGDLAFIEGNVHIPFDIKRVYYLYDVPVGAQRGGHAHRSLQQVLIAVSGSFEVYLDDGQSRITRHLSRPDAGLFIGPMVWREINHFSPHAVCLVLASQRFDEDDYFREYSAFEAALSGRYGRSVF